MTRPEVEELCRAEPLKQVAVIGTHSDFRDFARKHKCREWSDRGWAISENGKIRFQRVYESRDIHGIEWEDIICSEFDPCHRIPIFSHFTAQELRRLFVRRQEGL